MASGYPGGGGGGEFYGGIRIPGRSMLQNGAVVPNNTNPNPCPLPSPYRTTTNNNLQQHQLPQIFLDQTIPPPPTSLLRNQISHRLTPSMIGKRTLAEFQHHQIYQRQSNSTTPAALSNLLMLRSVKPRHMMAQSPISPLELSPNINLGRWSQLRPNQVGPQMIATHQDPSFLMAKKLEELEKQLLDDDDDENESVLTSFDNNNGNNNSGSEWSEPLNLMAPSANPISQSPTTSSSSSSCSSVAPACTRQNLLEAASAISESRNDAALEILSRAAVQPPPNASPEMKLVGFLAGALKSRVNPGENPPPVSELYSRDHAESTRSLYELSPCFKLGFMAANLAIVDAAQGCDAIHVIDFDVGQGAGQYVNLLHTLSSVRGIAPSLLKLTAVHDREEDGRLAEVAEMLTLIAERVGVQFRFKSVELGKFGGFAHLTRASLGVDEDEAVAVNFAFKLYRVPDESASVENPRDELLRRVRGLSPLVVTIVEQEMNVNTAPFLPRVGELCAYYGALLESMEATVTRESGERVKAEIGIGRRLTNAVACEGRDRVERCEVFGKWRSRLGMAGFVSKPVGQSVAETMRNRVSSVNGRTNPGFTVKEEAGRVCFGWMEKTLTVASAWR